MSFLDKLFKMVTGPESHREWFPDPSEYDFCMFLGIKAMGWIN
jgi:hypothetical protein